MRTTVRQTREELRQRAREVCPRCRAGEEPLRSGGTWWHRVAAPPEAFTGTGAAAFVPCSAALVWEEMAALEWEGEVQPSER